MSTSSTPTWYACDFLTGYIICELPSLIPQGALSRRLGTYTSTTFNLLLGGAPDGWQAATQYGRVLLVACADDEPAWAGSATVRNRGSAPTADLTAATAEGYLDRRYAGDLTFTATDTALIAAGLVAPVAATVPCMDVITTLTGTLADRVYVDSDDKTVYSNLTELMGTDGGPEWTVNPVWNSDRSGFRLEVVIGPQIGTILASPTAVFDYPGCVASYQEASSYEDGKGATVIRATGAGEGTTRAVSSDHTSTLIAAGWPVYEYRWSPGSDITDTTILDSHAQAALTLMESGASAWSLTAAWSQAPLLGTDWQLGDSVRLVVEAGESPGHPEGADVSARCWAWEWDTAAGTVAPIIVEGN